MIDIVVLKPSVQLLYKRWKMKQVVSQWIEMITAQEHVGLCTMLLLMPVLM